MMGASCPYLRKGKKLMETAAFRPLNDCYLIAGATTAPTGVQVSSSKGIFSILVYNSGTVSAFMSYATTAALATSEAVIPTAGTPQTIISLPPGSIQTFNLPGLHYFISAITASGTASIYIVSGDGV